MDFLYKKMQQQYRLKIIVCSWLSLKGNVSEGCRNTIILT